MSLNPHTLLMHVLLIKIMPLGYWSKVVTIHSDQLCLLLPRVMLLNYYQNNHIIQIDVYWIIVFIAKRYDYQFG